MQNKLNSKPIVRPPLTRYSRSLERSSYGVEFCWWVSSTGNKIVSFPESVVESEERHDSGRRRICLSIFRSLELWKFIESLFSSFEKKLYSFAKLLQFSRGLLIESFGICSEMVNAGLEEVQLIRYTTVVSLSFLISLSKFEEKLMLLAMSIFSMLNVYGFVGS